MSALQQRIAVIAERYHRENPGTFHPGDLAELLMSELGLTQEWIDFKDHAVGITGSPPVGHEAVWSTRYVTAWRVWEPWESLT